MNLSNTTDLRNQLLSEKDFLSHIYLESVNSKRKIINKKIKDASDKQLALLVVILHKVVKKEIVFYKKYYRKLTRSTAEPLLDRLNTKAETHKLLRSPRKSIIAFLTNFSHLFPGFLHYLFHKQIK